MKRMIAFFAVLCIVTQKTMLMNAQPAAKTVTCATDVKFSLGTKLLMSKLIGTTPRWVAIEYDTIADIRHGTRAE